MNYKTGDTVRVKATGQIAIISGEDLNRFELEDLEGGYIMKDGAHSFTSDELEKVELEGGTDPIDFSEPPTWNALEVYHNAEIAKRKAAEDAKECALHKLLEESGFPDDDKEEPELTPEQKLAYQYEHLEHEQQQQLIHPDINNL